MNYRFSPEARVDLLAAADFYETQQAALGTEFAVDVGLGLARLLEAPRRWPELEPGIRRYRLDHFSLRVDLSNHFRTEGGDHCSIRSSPQAGELAARSR